MCTCICKDRVIYTLPDPKEVVTLVPAAHIFSPSATGTDDAAPVGGYRKSVGRLKKTCIYMYAIYDTSIYDKVTRIRSYKLCGGSILYIMVHRYYIMVYSRTLSMSLHRAAHLSFSNADDTVCSVAWHIIRYISLCTV